MNSAADAKKPDGFLPGNEAVEIDDKATGKKKKKHGEAKEKEDAVSYFSLFRYSNKREKVMVVLGCLAAAAQGAIIPVFAILMGDIIDVFGPETGPDELVNAVREKALVMVYFGLVAFVLAFFQVSLLMLSSQLQGRRIRELYFQSLLSQDMTWYDGIVSAELTTRVSGDVVKVEAGIGDKLGSFLQYIAMSVAGMVIGFTNGWKLSLVILSVCPLLVICGAFMSKIIATYATAGQTLYAQAGGLAEQALSLIRTVAAFGGEEKELAQYKDELKEAYKTGIVQGNAQGLGMGATMFCICGVYALGFWYGNKLITSGEQTAGDVLTVFFSIVLGGMALGQAAPSLSVFNVARGAAFHLFEVVDRKPEIDSLSDEGRVLTEINGELSLDHVNFTYKSRQETMILNDLSLQIKRGETLALVGASGCGKSTVIQLLERFYDPLDGAVRLDNIDIREINVQWLRSQIGFVSQMPTLFATTIANNIRWGAGLAVNPNYNPNLASSRENRKFQLAEVSMEDIEKAAKMSNAHNFIMALPKGYNTVIGERGAQLSGGQKQRIAIARALVKNPSILLLDEATSALDSHSEQLVQDALEIASKGRTTVVVAHRLSTVKNADHIAVIEHGRIVEIGSDAELMAIPDGKYRNFVELQQLSEEAESNEGAEEIDPDYVAMAMDVQEAERKESIGRKRLPSMSSSRRPISSGQRETDQSTSSSESEDDESKTEQEKKMSRRQKQKEKRRREKEQLDPHIFRKVMVANKPEWPWLTLGSISAAVNGAVWPFFAVIFAEAINQMMYDNNKVKFWVIMFVMVGVITFFSQWLSITSLNVAGERLTFRLRGDCFETMLHQPIEWFDETENSVGVLTTRLSTEAADVKKVSTNTINVVITQVATIVTGLAIALTQAWRLALVVLAMAPLIGAGAFMQMKQMAGFATDGHKVYKHAGRIASEAVDNIRTVTSLAAAPMFQDKYDLELEKPAKKGRTTSAVAGAGFAFTQFMMFAVWAVAFYYGSQLVARGDHDFAQIMKALSAVIFGAMTIGELSGLAPDAAKAKVSASSIFRLLDLNSNIDSRSLDGKMAPEVKGDVVYSNVFFEYPTRKEVPLLKGLSVSVSSGQTLALVGESGCGKSTLVALLERFYNPRAGTVSVDGQAIDAYNLRWLRSQMGIVSQEPDLFNTTIRENILYGLPKDRLNVVTQEMIESAAKLANAHDFIMEQPNGYDQEVGERGGKLSGGQKQRVAIARAMIRNPHILLLDEATSALDSESEKVVQQALDKARAGRTTIVIAHRLATIQDADIIAVVSNGRVCEKGTHAQLLGLGGVYAKMVENQQHST